MSEGKEMTANETITEEVVEGLPPENPRIGVWTPLMEEDGDGGFLERSLVWDGWLVRYRNPHGKTLSGLVFVPDNRHEWKIDKKAKWVTDSTMDDRDSSWMERYPVHNGWFIGHGSGSKRLFQSCIYAHGEADE